MGTEILIAAISAVISVLVYFAGVRRGEHLERGRQEHERALQRQREEHERQLAIDQREAEMASKLADEYVEMSRRRFDSGVTALARLGLHRLGSDRLIRQAIDEMRVRTNADPWSGQEAEVAGIDLVEFFGTVSDRKVNFFESTVADIAAQAHNAGGAAR